LDSSEVVHMIHADFFLSEAAPADFTLKTLFRVSIIH